MWRLPATTSSTRSSTVPGHTRRCDTTVRVWPMRHAVAGLILDRRVPPAVVEHDVARRGEVEPGAAGLEREHERTRTLAALEVGDQLVARAAGQAAVVARDRHAGDLGEVVGQALAPLREVGEHQDPLAGGEHRLDDLLEPGQLAGTARERPAVVLVRGGMVADLLQRGDRGEDRTLARLLRSSPPASATRRSSTAW